jgi:SNF2 family DNA or RNA helicase
MMPFAYSKPIWTPHGYQRRAIQFLLERGAAALFLEPGLGKTSITLAAFKVLKDKGLAQRMLVIAPLRVAHNVWPVEIWKWAEFDGLRCVVLHGSTKDRALRTDADIYVINPEGLSWLMTEGRCAKIKADVLCIDELSKFKHTTTQRFKLLKPMLRTFQRRWGLTGTPASNGLMDLFGQCYVLDEGAALGRWVSHFRSEYFTQINTYEWVPKPDAFARVLDKLRPLALHMAAEDYLDLPELVPQTIKVQLSKAARSAYDQMETRFYFALASTEVSAVSKAASGIKCRQIANGAAYDDLSATIHLHDAKLDALGELLEELNGTPALVLYEFDHDRQRILEKYPGTPCIGGGVSQRQAEAAIMEFNAGTLPMLLAHPASAGHGLNLQQVSNHVVWFGIPWDLELYDQAIGRVHRQGNPNSHVFVHHIVAENTLDEKVMRVLERKGRVQKSLLAALKEDIDAVSAC